MKPSERWKDICAKATRGGSVHRRGELDDLEAKHGLHQLIWAMNGYAKTTPYPNLRDLADWIGRQELPEEVVCAAYLSGEPSIVRLADELETMLGAWFPEADDEEEIQRLRERLGKVLL